MSTIKDPNHLSDRDAVQNHDSCTLHPLWFELLQRLSTQVSTHIANWHLLIDFYGFYFSFFFAYETRVCLISCVEMILYVTMKRNKRHNRKITSFRNTFTLCGCMACWPGHCSLSSTAQTNASLFSFFQDCKGFIVKTSPATVYESLNHKSLSGRRPMRYYLMCDMSIISCFHLHKFCMWLLAVNTTNQQLSPIRNLESNPKHIYHQGADTRLM